MRIGVNGRNNPGATRKIPLLSMILPASCRKNTSPPILLPGFQWFIDWYGGCTEEGRGEMQRLSISEVEIRSE
jgi:hypothetical protein